MSTTAQAGILGFGPQPEKGTLASDWYRHRATMIDLDVADDVREGVPEVGGIAVPTFPYKAGPVVVGGFTLQPRYENTLGWLLHALLGSHSTSPTGTLTPNSVVNAQSLTSLGAVTLAGNPASASKLKITGTGQTALSTVIMTITGALGGDFQQEVVSLVAGVSSFTSKAFDAVTSINIDQEVAAGTFVVGSFAGAPYDHTFEMLAGDSAFVPWVSLRKSIPRHGGDAASDLGQIFKDCKIVGATLALPNDSPLSLRMDVLGREFSLDAAPDAWTWVNSFEDWRSIPVACQTGGFLKIAGEELPIVNASVSWQNVPLDPRMEKVYGDPFLNDVTVIQRRLQYDLTCLWQDPKLYRRVLTGAPTGLDVWSGTPFTGTFSVRSESSTDMPGTSERYALQIDASEVMMTQVGGLQLAGNSAIMLRFSGVALEADSYASFILHNLTPAYDWPAASS